LGEGEARRERRLGAFAPVSEREREAQEARERALAAAGAAAALRDENTALRGREAALEESLKQVRCLLFRTPLATGARLSVVGLPISEWRPSSGGTSSLDAPRQRSDRVRGDLKLVAHAPDLRAAPDRLGGRRGLGPRTSSTS